jgi:hypothetical protein
MRTIMKRTTNEKIGRVTEELYAVIFKFLEITPHTLDKDGFAHVEAYELDMLIVLNSLGNVAVGLLSSLPDTQDQMVLHQDGRRLGRESRKTDE